MQSAGELGGFSAVRAAGVKGLTFLRSWLGHDPDLVLNLSQSHPEPHTDSRAVIFSGGSGGLILFPYRMFGDVWSHYWLS